MQTSKLHISAGSSKLTQLKSVKNTNTLPIKSLASQKSRNQRQQICTTAMQKTDQGSINRTPSPQVLDLLRTMDAICFDVDSTFCQDESIDELAAFLGMGEQVAALTAQAMGGTMKFQDALALRLGVMKPTAADVDRFLKEHPHLVTPGIPQLIKLLRSRNQQVFLVSGGFRQIIHPLAESLDIPITHVFANTILFNNDDDGSYAGFDENEFTSRSGGKCEAVKHIKSEWKFNKIAMMGDGATDLEARQPGGADVFIGYGGVVFRENIAEQADWYVMDIQEVIDAIA